MEKDKNQKRERQVAIWIHAPVHVPVWKQAYKLAESEQKPPKVPYSLQQTCDQLAHTEVVRERMYLLKGPKQLYQTIPDNGTSDNSQKLLCLSDVVVDTQIHMLRLHVQ